MKTDITIYHKILGLGKNPDTFKINHLKNVSWQGGDGASVNKGYEKANDIKLRIFKKDNQDVFELPFSIGDFIVLGITDQEISKQSDIKDKTYNITTIIPHKRGTITTQHIEIGAK